MAIDEDLRPFNRVVWIIQVRFAKRYCMNDDMSSLGALMFHESWGERRSFDDSFLLWMRKYLYIYVLVVSK